MAHSKQQRKANATARKLANSSRPLLSLKQLTAQLQSLTSKTKRLELVKDQCKTLNEKFPVSQIPKIKFSKAKSQLCAVLETHLTALSIPDAPDAPVAADVPIAMAVDTALQTKPKRRAPPNLTKSAKDTV